MRDLGETVNGLGGGARGCEELGGAFAGVGVVEDGAACHAEGVAKADLTFVAQSYARLSVLQRLRAEQSSVTKSADECLLCRLLSVRGVCLRFVAN